MLKKLEKEILRTENKKQIKLSKRKELDAEITELNTKTKELYSLKNQYIKLQVGVEELMDD